MSEEKTKPPTPKKLQDAHEEGESIRSVDATSAGVLAVAAGALWLSAGFLMDRFTRLFDMVWEHLPREHESVVPLLSAMAGELWLLTVPFAIVTMAGAAIALMLQGSMTMSAKPVMLKLESVNPVAGLKRIFGMKAIIEAGTTLLKGGALLALLYFSLEQLLPLLVGATARSPEFLGVLMWQVLMRLVFISLALFIVFGAIDYGIQRAMFIRDHRMSEDEVKRENKEQNGNPEVKQTRKELAQELLLGDAPAAAVKSANMVVANPIHFAVAIHYQRGGVPQVVAKGRDDVALQIRALAELHHVPVIVNPPLARTLYKVPLGSGIPRECFQMVGLMLHWVDQLGATRDAPATEPGA
ncbi:EscU/YscU/HrcU family type III secretion system export apparatus switch protein [Xylophilus sp. GOD-11R]|uniref:EscU/YscU/HrcU family type III secretion system export apparatus switch protein n=1 Tax=Xylophilus sp. GOD-11R TaxID=3089814 RepID=UPI00298C866B|nr:EscU/YscU/HrcU family type III secretion system export apparatus switch protein [Xylophilus sp. GOD-11R]WPB57948.1 EscU/YscU/HrcU family type III secretion system export apparatus switch protein [Xylophilus sp. GOD-11R]